MGKIPRAIKNPTGYVICTFGPLAYADEEDKRELLSLAQIYNKAFKRGAITHDPEYGMPKTDPNLIKEGATHLKQPEPTAKPALLTSLRRLRRSNLM